MLDITVGYVTLYVRTYVRVYATLLHIHSKVRNASNSRIIMLGCVYSTRVRTHTPCPTIPGYCHYTSQPGRIRKPSHTDN